MTGRPTATPPRALHRRFLSAALVINHGSLKPSQQTAVRPLSKLEIIEVVDFYAAETSRVQAPKV